MIKDGKVKVTVYIIAEGSDTERKTIHIIDMKSTIKTTPLSDDNLLIIECIIDIMYIILACKCVRDDLISRCGSVVQPILNKIGSVAGRRQKMNKVYQRIVKTIEEHIYQNVQKSISDKLSANMKTLMDQNNLDVMISKYDTPKSTRDKIREQLLKQVPKNLRNNEEIMEKIPAITEALANSLSKNISAEGRKNGTYAYPFSFADEVGTEIESISIGGIGSDKRDSGKTRSDLSSPNDCVCPNCSKKMQERADKKAKLMHIDSVKDELRKIETMGLTREERDVSVKMFLIANGMKCLSEKYLKVLHKSDKASDDLIKQVENESGVKKKTKKKSKKKSEPKVEQAIILPPLAPKQKKKENRAARRAGLHKIPEASIEEDPFKTLDTKIAETPCSAIPKIFKPLCPEILETPCSEILETPCPEILETPCPEILETPRSETMLMQFASDLLSAYSTSEKVIGVVDVTDCPPGFDAEGKSGDSVSQPHPQLLRRNPYYYDWMPYEFMRVRGDIWTPEYNKIMDIPDEQQQVESFFSSYDSFAKTSGSTPNANGAISFGKWRSERLEERRRKAP